MLARRLPRPARALLSALAALTVLSGVAAAPAGAAIPWAACPTAGYQCAHVDVPLDRTGAVPGTVSLAVSRVAAASNPGSVAVVPPPGGPGQAALPLSETFAQVLAPAIQNRDLLIFDQRGT